MKKFDEFALKLCEYQAKLFSLSTEKTTTSSPIFIRRFMYSNVALRIDTNAFLWEATTENDIFDEITSEFGETSYGKIKFTKNELYWIGYLYRYWAFTHEKSSKQVYKIVKPHELQKLYQPYHTLDPMQAIERIKEAKGIEVQDLIKKGVELLRKLRNG